MVTKLTHSEHHARAMLMGRWYDWRDGTYCDDDGAGLSVTMICCVTLEEVKTRDAERRTLEVFGTNRYNLDLDRPDRDTPWARMDEELP